MADRIERMFDDLMAVDTDAGEAALIERIGELESRPVFEAYAAAHLQRPAALRANARDDALVAARAGWISPRSWPCNPTHGWRRSMAA